MLKFSAHGKLLLTGEYLVMEGAQALALPLKKGQHLQVTPLAESCLIWEAFTPSGLWLSAQFRLPDFKLINSSNPALTDKLIQIFREVFSVCDFCHGGGYHVISQLDFDPEYGFGSSATLISLLSQWRGFNPYRLHHKMFGGSGYDIACATAKGPLLYSIQKDQPKVIPIHFFPDFHHQLYFVYLGKKQRSSSEIDRFRQKSKFSTSDVQRINELTSELCNSVDLFRFEQLLYEHEALMSRILTRPTVQEECFPQYKGVVKSLGAWGGDFVLVTSSKEEKLFRHDMKAQGYGVVYSFKELVLQ